MAKWTLREMINNVRKRIDDDSQDFISDAEIKDYLNVGIFDIANQLQIETIYEETLESPIQSLDLPEDFLQYRILYINGQMVTLGSLEDRKSSNNLCYIWNNKLFFTKEQNGLVEFFYFKKPTALVADQDVCPELPEQHQVLPILYAFARCKEKDEEMGQAMALRDQYLQMRAEMISEVHNKKTLNTVTFVNDEY